MLDAKLLRSNPPGIREIIQARNGDPDHLDRWLEADRRHREILGRVEGLRAEKARASAEIGRRRKAGEDASGDQARVRELGEELGTLEEGLKPLEEEVERLAAFLPNLPHESVPRGDETLNRVVRTWGEPIRHDFPAAPHHETGERLRILEMHRGTLVSGPGFSVLRGAGARLERALINFFLDVHVREHGYTEVAAPFIVRRECLFGTGQLPRLEGDMYRTDDDLFLIPTAEVSITNLYRGEILEAGDLPIRLAGYSPCFRREAGTYGKETKGLTRVHQFSKVEMVRITSPGTSYAEHEELLRDAEDLLQRLNLPYRVVLLASGDTSFAAAKCYDLEVYAPGCDRWLEVSSCSNFEAFQARRINLRFRPEGGGKPSFVHTLNASGLALPRIIVAILENFQTGEGAVRIPPVLRPWMGGDQEISARG